MNYLSKYLVAGGIAVTATALSYKQQWCDSYIPYSWRSHISSFCKESSTVESSSTSTGTVTHQEGGVDTGDLYCFYCGRGGGRKEGTVNEGVSRSLGKVKMSEKPEVLAAICNSRRMLKSEMLEQGVPGVVVAVVKDGECVWSEGLGLADVENDSPCTSQSVMRIASICKPLSAVALLQLHQAGKVDLDAPIQTYVPDFPRKKYEGEEVEVTVRMLMAHLAGIRHYQKYEEGEGKKGEFAFKEYYNTKHYDNMNDSLKMFAEDDLISKPGSKYNYTTLGWTLLGAVIENASGQSYLQYMKDHIFAPLGMTTTRGEFHAEIIHGRAKCYFRGNGGLLKNSPYIDPSYKWAGGGLVSNAEDLARFGSAVLTCWQLASGAHDLHAEACDISAGSHDQCLLHPAITHLMLTQEVTNVDEESNGKSSSPAPHFGYGLGWLIRPPKKGLMGGIDYPLVFGHTGGAVGCCSVLIVIPDQPDTIANSVKENLISNDLVLTPTHKNRGPKGVVVAIMLNLQSVKGVCNLGVKIAEEFRTHNN